MTKFQRIYWLGAFDWQAYARLYDKYCRLPNNYYEETAQRLISAVRIQNNSDIIDAGAGTGALTRELLKKKLGISITAIDLSPEMLHCYKKEFRKQIASRQIKVFRGNAEQLHKHVKKKVDIIFVASAVWDMELSTFFNNTSKVLKPGGIIVFNLPALVLGKPRGFIGFIEKTVRKEMPGKQLYRRILPAQLQRIFKKFKYSIVEAKPYQFPLSKRNVAQFFTVLKYRYPFILFPKTMPYQERLKLCTKMFNLALRRLPDKGLKEEGTIFVIKKT